MTGSFDDIGEAYARERRAYQRTHNDPVMCFIEANIPPASRTLLDAGCGSGEDLERLSGREWADLVGIDDSTVMVDLARELVGDRARVLRASILSLPFGKAEFDVIISRFSLHYLEDTGAVYREFARCLQSEGTLIFVIPHPSFFESCRIAEQSTLLRTRPFGGLVELSYPYRAMNHCLSDTFFSLFHVVKIQEFYLDESVCHPTGLGILAIPV